MNKIEVLTKAQKDIVRGLLALDAVAHQEFVVEECDYDEEDDTYPFLDSLDNTARDVDRFIDKWIAEIKRREETE